MSGLPAVPKVELDVVADRSEERDGFLSLTRLDLAITGESGRRSPPFRYDVVQRRALDASIIVAHFRGESGAVHVYLRSSIRPPAGLRSGPRAPTVMWEVPAGLIEPGEAPIATAARELEEELGFRCSTEAVQPLGPDVFPCPALIGELHHYFHVEVTPATRREPLGDGSPLEEAAQIVSLPLSDALAACRAGAIDDAKTELALRRLADVL